MNTLNQRAEWDVHVNEWATRNVHVHVTDILKLMPPNLKVSGEITATYVPTGMQQTWSFSFAFKDGEYEIKARPCIK